MLLRQKSSGHMVEVVNYIDLIDLNRDEVIGCYQEGEEVQDPDNFKKQDLVFLSGEKLPRCWMDPHYRDDELSR
ncbi:MAG: acetyltransferase [Gammaproteobacteria bacterium]|nr:acetyltransferase [Gammaproteobacteria bacterium]